MPCSRVTHNNHVVGLGFPRCEGRTVGTHSAWALVDTTVICLVMNSEPNPHKVGQTAAGRDYWLPRFFPLGVVVDVLNKFNWSRLLKRLFAARVFGS
jgi:hypothetical protein